MLRSRNSRAETIAPHFMHTPVLAVTRSAPASRRTDERVLVAVTLRAETVFHCGRDPRAARAQVDVAAPPVGGEVEHGIDIADCVTVPVAALVCIEDGAHVLPRCISRATRCAFVIGSFVAGTASASVALPFGNVLARIASVSAGCSRENG